MSKKLVSIKAKRPNKLFEQWLREWIQEESQEPKRKCYETALKALQKYPLPIATGRECIILQGFGEKLCKQIDDKLHPLQQPMLIDYKILSIDNTSDKVVNTEEVGLAKQTKTLSKSKVAANNVNRNGKIYCPAYRSGGYAILCALYQCYTENNEDTELGVMLKRHLIISAQRFCDKSFTKSDQGCLYTAWSSMSTLLAKQLVTKHGNPAKFQLTDAGVQCAKALFEDALKDPENALVINQIIEAVDVPKTSEGNKRKLQKIPSTYSAASSVPSTSSSQNTDVSSQQELESLETFIFTPGSFKVYLLIDKQETSGATKKDLYDEIIMELNSMCVHYEIRHLKIGDYAWICRHDETQQELVLPYIVERKRMDDFGASIKDGRFHEQKFRLKQSGIQHLIYLVESYGSNLHCGMPLSSIHQAATNTLLQDGFALKFTDDIRQTAEYLAMFTTALRRIFVEKTLMNCAKVDLQKCELGDDLIGLMAFKEFNLSSSKNKAMKVSDMFVKQLLQLHGISVDKAMAIVAKYPTPRMLKFAYDACATEKEAEGMLSNVEFGTLGKKVGPVISTTLYQLYNFKDY